MRAGRAFRSAVILTLALGGSLAAAQQLTRQAADQFAAKLLRIAVQGQSRAPAGGARTTQVSDDELNAYLRHHAQDQIPAGIVEPTITALGDGRVGGRVLVDLDAVRAQRPRGWLDPLGYLTGRLPLTATGTLVTKDGVGRFTLESAELAGVTVPRTLIQELLTFYSKTPENPAGINMDAPFELPANIREIRVGKAQATIVQ